MGKVTRKQFDSLMEELEGAKIYSLEDYEPKAVSYKEIEQIHCGLDPDKHRWYEMTEQIYKVGDFYIGEWTVTQTYSEMQTIEDCGIEAKFYEVFPNVEEKITFKTSKQEKDDKPKFEKCKPAIWESDYRIENDSDAERMVKLITDLKADNERLIAICEESIKEYQMKIQGYQEEIANMVTPIQEQLFNYMQTCEVKETKTQFSYKLPSATLKYTKSKADYSKDDTKLLEWVKGNKSDLIKVEESVDWATLKKELKIVEDKVITKDGEVVEGIEVVEKEGKFEIK